MTGPRLPLCHGSAIISNDWQEHKLASVFVVWFTFLFPVLRYLRRYLWPAVLSEKQDIIL